MFWDYGNRNLAKALSFTNSDMAWTNTVFRKKQKICEHNSLPVSSSPMYLLNEDVFSKLRYVCCYIVVSLTVICQDFIIYITLI